MFFFYDKRGILLSKTHLRILIWDKLQNSNGYRIYGYINKGKSIGKLARSIIGKFVYPVVGVGMGKGGGGDYCYFSQLRV